jgi:hypothetical protein
MYLSMVLDSDANQTLQASDVLLAHNAIVPAKITIPTVESCSVSGIERTNFFVSPLKKTIRCLKATSIVMTRRRAPCWCEVRYPWQLADNAKKEYRTGVEPFHPFQLADNTQQLEEGDADEEEEHRAGVKPFHPFQLVGNAQEEHRAGVKSFRPFQLASNAIVSGHATAAALGVEWKWSFHSSFELPKLTEQEHSASGKPSRPFQLADKAQEEHRAGVKPFHPFQLASNAIVSVSEDSTFVVSGVEWKSSFCSSFELSKAAQEEHRAGVKPSHPFQLMMMKKVRSMSTAVARASTDNRTSDCMRSALEGSDSEVSEFTDDHESAASEYTDGLDEQMLETLMRSSFCSTFELSEAAPPVRRNAGVSTARTTQLTRTGRG